MNSMMTDAVNNSNDDDASVQRYADDTYFLRNEKRIIHRHIGLRNRRKILSTVSVAKDPIPLLKRRKRAADFLRDHHSQIDVPRDQAFAVVKPEMIPEFQDLAEYLRASFKTMKKPEEPRNGINPLLITEDLLEIDVAKRFIFSDAIIGAATKYIGSIPLLSDAAFWWTPVNEGYRGAQMFHIDGIPDIRTLRFLINVNDVGPENGPPTLIPRPATVQVIDNLGYLGGPVLDRDIEEVISPADFVASTGPSGSGVALDTTNVFHFGSRARQKERLVFSMTFVSYYCREPLNIDPEQAKRHRHPQLGNMLLSPRATSN